MIIKYHEIHSNRIECSVSGTLITYYFENDLFRTDGRGSIHTNVILEIRTWYRDNKSIITEMTKLLGD